jgi:hypothetical protein
MWKDLAKAYIPACMDCMCDKGQTSKLSSPLHPLPIPEGCRDSIAINFIRSFPQDNCFNCIVTITDHLGSDIWIAPTHIAILAECFATQFFDLWYCENELLLSIVSNHNKIFVSKFWKALMTLTGVKLKMSSAYHPETDGSNECSNKTVVV